MAKFFLSRRYRPNIWPFWVLVGIEFCLTVALLAFVGIAAPNLYRTKLQADGALNGFNSSPAAKLYAAANYRSYTTPMVWSQFITNYNLVIVVLSMFLLLCKSIMYMLHVFPPIVNCFVHIILILLYSLSCAWQASSDTSDPTRPQNGPAWYITKSCSVAYHSSNIGYCQQAKATFFCAVAMLAVDLTYFGFAAFSCFPTKQHQMEYEEKQRIKKEKYGFLDEEPKSRRKSKGKQAESRAFAVDSSSDNQRSIGTLNPMTPRTLAFNILGGTKDLPMRNEAPKPSTTFNLRSPGLPRTPAAQRFAEVSVNDVVDQKPSGVPMFFPPPPKVSSKK